MSNWCAGLGSNQRLHGLKARSSTTELPAQMDDPLGIEPRFRRSERRVLPVRREVNGRLNGIYRSQIPLFLGKLYPITNGAPGWNRTNVPPVKSRQLWPLSYQRVCLARHRVHSCLRRHICILCDAVAEAGGIEPPRGSHPITVFGTDKHAGLAHFHCLKRKPNFNMAEAAGFEPARPVRGDGLANRWFRPLTQTSIGLPGASRTRACCLRRAAARFRWRGNWSRWQESNLRLRRS